MPRPGYLARAGLDDLDPGGLRSLNHAAPAWKRDDQVREGLGNHALIAHGAVVRPCPVPFRQEVPFEDAVFPRPFPGNAIDAARPAVDQAVEWAASGAQAIQRALDEFGVSPITPAADQDSQRHRLQLIPKRAGFAAILAGKQPPGLTANKLMADTRLPLDWRDQRAALGFA